MNITINDAQGGIEEIKAAVVRELITAHKADFDLITPAQAGGILDLTQKGLDALKLPKVDLLGNGRSIRYRLGDITEKLNERTVKAAKK
ncbi:hypothetical protein OJ996_08955 [Luteolibacter sp. GHJ8]|uniref:DNA-binding protein n=1 Tax=Luteolibacter rhizosphaerae TaxID=2989719 RepID=A0ABT3G1I2_9BACT|nr:hypothetical protein [Luteolibacter rhizosphaerae]MCW1913701.1 hypothetical protein [Luteolibacter rhizosphaerae]